MSDVAETENTKIQTKAHICDYQPNLVSEIAPITIICN